MSIFRISFQWFKAVMCEIFLDNVINLPPSKRTQRNEPNLDLMAKAIFDSIFLTKI